MKKFIYRKKPKRNSLATTQKQFIRGLVSLICLSLIIIFIFGDHGLIKLYKIKGQRKKIQGYITQLRKDREQIKEEKNRIENDLDYIEKIAREKYKMVKPGEKIFKVVEN